MIESAEGASEENLEHFMQDPQKIKEFRPNFSICVIECPVQHALEYAQSFQKCRHVAKSGNKTPHVLRAIPKSSKHSFASATGVSEENCIFVFEILEKTAYEVRVRVKA